MKTNRWIALSQRFYHQLLHLYPQAYRATYEMEMLRAFKNQCREAYQQQGRLGILLLWPRTLVDVGITVVREHLSDPQATVGLLDAMPNAPLPWKGVLLVLIPGLIFFVSQVEQLTSNNDWFFLAFYRAGFFLMLPVLLVWLITHRFPIWGLIPFGLLYGTLTGYPPIYWINKLPYQYLDSVAVFGTPSVELFGTRFELDHFIRLGYLIPVSACVVLLLGLIWYHNRQGQIPRRAWKWMGIYGLLIVLRIMEGLYHYIRRESQFSSSVDLKSYFLDRPLWYFYESLPFLLLVFIGLLFARRYEGFSFLVLLGYLLPAVIFGRYDTRQDPVPFWVVSLAILVYRFVVALVAPVWLVRAASIPSRQRAAVIPVVLAILCHISLNVIVSLAWRSQYDDSLQTTLLNLVSIIWHELTIVAGLGLAVSLYLPQGNDQTVVSPPTLIAATE